MINKADANRQKELAIEILKKSDKLRTSYAQEFHINIDNIHNDPMFIDLIINDGISTNVFSADEVRRFLFPEKYQEKKYDITGYECSEMVINRNGDIIWVEKPDMGIRRSPNIPSWESNEIPYEWAGHRFKVIRVSEKPEYLDKSKFQPIDEGEKKEKKVMRLR